MTEHLTEQERRDGQTAVALVTLYRDYSLGRSELQPSEEDFLAVFGPSTSLDTILGTSAALVAMVITLLEAHPDSDELFRELVRHFQED